MILPDVNLILYAYDLDSPFHRVAATWWTKCLSSAEPVGLAQVVVFAFLRLSTSPRIFANPFPVDAAIREALPRSSRVSKTVNSPLDYERFRAEYLGVRTEVNKGSKGGSCGNAVLGNGVGTPVADRP